MNYIYCKFKQLVMLKISEEYIVELHLKKQTPIKTKEKGVNKGKKKNKQKNKAGRKNISPFLSSKCKWRTWSTDDLLQPLSTPRPGFLCPCLLEEHECSPSQSTKGYWKREPLHILILTGLLLLLLLQLLLLCFVFL